MAEWPCCHDPLRFSPMSLRFVPPLSPRAHPGTRGHRGCDGPSARPATEKRSPQVPGPPPHRASAPVERDNILQAPDGPRKRIPSPGPPHPGTCSGRRRTISSYPSTERAHVIVPKSDIGSLGTKPNRRDGISDSEIALYDPRKCSAPENQKQISNVDQSL